MHLASLDLQCSGTRLKTEVWFAWFVRLLSIWVNLQFNYTIIVNMDQKNNRIKLFFLNQHFSIYSKHDLPKLDARYLSVEKSLTISWIQPLSKRIRNYPTQQNITKDCLKYIQMNILICTNSHGKDSSRLPIYFLRSDNKVSLSSNYSPVAI